MKAGQLTLSGVVDDGGNTYGVTLAGGGTLTYTNANTYSGMTDVTADRRAPSSWIAPSAGACPGR